MFLWINIFTCPSILFCPRNPHPKGNDYCTIFFSESGIIYGWDIFKGNDHTIPMGRLEFNKIPNMKMV